MNASTYNGVTRADRNESRPWRAQCSAAGKNHHLGTFETEEQAAKAYDNFVYHLRDSGFQHPGKLNFAKEYTDNPPPMTSTTRLAIFDCVERKGSPDPRALPKVVGQILPFLRQLARALPELEAAHAGQFPAENDSSVNNSSTPSETPEKK